MNALLTKPITVGDAVPEFLRLDTLCSSEIAANLPSLWSSSPLPKREIS